MWVFPKIKSPSTSLNLRHSKGFNALSLSELYSKNDIPLGTPPYGTDPALHDISISTLH
jgi:hypothetical protein